ncbi:poly-beta-1,6-N-acetyl-D-glucosamine biosynthesis protein PgaD [Lysobacter enzymogenes]|uniref:poly-beta-1,6-N-acetyl-D-glucosamine biosynthesis protein PgaD n=1 Tax=Lysobacter enzymogenes TaxID=69 RepID=UPI00089C07F3|nr:poly-beta-1,6-N-acetyl-D-glucosamine biosynthesis protein PgaD [Lysobacter enzymogenes]SDX24000.1 poly-beta-1,6-N-acetyl-D-glucosamine biosynthesis protein PgaD [Lysobacter enzymogenes]
MSNDRRPPDEGAPPRGADTGRAADGFSRPAHSTAAPPLAPAKSAAPAAPGKSNKADKPASHKHDSRLIQKPGSQHPLPRTLWGVVTGAFWLAYLYLWTPVLTLVLWLLGLRTVASELYLRTHEVDPFLMLALPATAAAVVALLLTWAEYNRWRFAGDDAERRTRLADVSLDEVAQSLGASAEVAQALNAGRVSVLHMDTNQAVPLSVTAVTPNPPAQNPFPPLPPKPRFTRTATAPSSNWLLVVALAAIALVIGVLIVVSHGYRQIESSEPVHGLEGAPGMDRPALPANADGPGFVGPADDAVAGTPDAATPNAAAQAASAKADAATRAREAKARREAQAKALAQRKAAAASAKPRPLPGFSPKPVYPLDALRQSESGLVTLRVQVSAQGEPTRVDVSRRSGFRALDRAAVSTVRRWKFAPAMREGKPVAAVVIVPVEFKPRD